ncbi:hypothetical protein ACFQV2_01480 [Actinokineospora soli]|uniref:Uncharacterized protein n=1 Tax=Actinokineospora soli TaxID=1048753 RepID=A0ABW2THD2_9PSEU
MEQLSFYSAEASSPDLADLAGLLCGPGRVRVFAGAAARLTVPVRDEWRAKALVRALRLRGVPVTRTVCEYTGDLELRTAFRKDLLPLALAWGQRKHVPDLTPDGNTLRLWAIAAGRWTEGVTCSPSTRSHRILGTAWSRRWAGADCPRRRTRAACASGDGVGSPVSPNSSVALPDRGVTRSGRRSRRCVWCHERVLVADGRVKAVERG